MTRKTVRIRDLKSLTVDSDDNDFDAERTSLVSADMSGTSSNQQMIGDGPSRNVLSDERIAPSSSTVYNVLTETKEPNFIQQQNTAFPRISSEDKIATHQNTSEVKMTPYDGIPNCQAPVSLSDRMPKFRSVVFTPPDFDELFKHPARLHFSMKGETVDEGIHSFDSGTSRVSSGSSSSKNADDIPPNWQKRPPKRRDSVMVLTFREMLVKNWEHSQGLKGFRHKLANDINHKYCSYCRCDDMIFIFLYVVFGITKICAGTLGLKLCSSELYVNVFFITDGILSVFIFPITIMEWTERIGGCVKENDVQGNGITYIAIVILRIAAAVSGSVLMAMRINVYPEDELMCWTVLRFLWVGVVLEWAFLLFVLLLPLLLYGAAYFVARTL